ncbi:MAG: hypothetical protein KJO50_04685, partial [Bacteroidia bacterium]|nr:hypothetical protein [Bacteroidia bacterium]
MRYLKKNGSWARALPTEYEKNLVEDSFETMDKDINPVEEFVDDKDAREFINKQLSQFLAFEHKISS